MIKCALRNAFWILTRYDTPSTSQRRDIMLLETSDTPFAASYFWPSPRKLASPRWDRTPPLFVGRLVIQGEVVRPLRTRPPLRIPPHPIVRTRTPGLPEHTRLLIPPRLEIVLRAIARAGVRPDPVPHQHEILRPVIRIQVPVHHLRILGTPSAPLPLLWPVAHERALVATGGDENICAFAGHGVFEPSPSAGALAIARTDPVMFWAKVGGHASIALVPPFVHGVILNERLFAWEAAARAKVLSGTPASASQKSVLLDVVCKWGLDRFHGSEI